MDPPDINDDVAAAAAEHARANSAGGAGTSTKRAREAEPTIEDFYFLGREIANRSGHRVGSEATEDERFRSHFGCGAHIALILYQRLKASDLIPEVSPTPVKHLLWALFFKKCYPKEKLACGTVGGSNGAIDPKTLRKYIWPFIKAISDLEPEVVSLLFDCTYLNQQSLLTFLQIQLENRFKLDRHNDCLLSVDGTDFMRSKTDKTWHSYKFKRSGIRYEVAVSILGGDICWISGPWRPGLYNDLDIFREGLLTWLEPGERCEGDDGYNGEAPLRIKCPASITEPKEKERMAKRVRNRHETVNKRFKQWAILEQPFRHDVINHRDVFSAVVVITQLAIENGEPLFDVHYDDFDFEVEFEEDV